MKNYKLKDATTILELETRRELIVRSSVAKQLCSRLNGGSGFRGWTPKFFTESFVIK